MKFKKRFKERENQTLFFNKQDEELEENYVSYHPTANRGKPETVLRYGGRYFILNGDLRKECEKCKNIEEVKEVFKNSNLEISCRSDENFVF